VLLLVFCASPNVNADLTWSSFDEDFSLGLLMLLLDSVTTTAAEVFAAPVEVPSVF